MTKHASLIKWTERMFTPCILSIDELTFNGEYVFVCQFPVEHSFIRIVSLPIGSESNCIFSRVTHGFAIPFDERAQSTRSYPIESSISNKLHINFAFKFVRHSALLCTPPRSPQHSHASFHRFRVNKCLWNRIIIGPSTSPSRSISCSNRYHMP